MSVKPTDDMYQTSDLEYKLFEQKPVGHQSNGLVSSHHLPEVHNAANDHHEHRHVRRTSVGRRSSQSASLRHKALPPQQPLGLFPFETSFFDKSPAATQAKKLYMKMVVGGTVMLIVIIFAIFPIFWGASWRTDRYVHNLNAFVVDFDGGPIGNATVTALTGPQFRGDRMIDWQIQDSSLWPGGPEQLREAILDQRAWLGVAILPGASDKLQAAVAAADPEYDGSTAIQVFAVEARSEGTFRNVIRPQVTQVFSMIAQRFAGNFARTVASTPNVDLPNLLTNAPQVLTLPFYYALDNTVPFDVPVASAVVFVGLIYLLILSLMVTILLGNAREMSGLERGLNLTSLIAMRMITPVFMYFFISLFYSLLSYAFDLPFNRRFGSSGFVIFWMLQWIGMLTLGFAIEAVLTLLTNKGLPLFIILWIITNVATCFVPLELLPGIFKFGYAWPFFNISEATRTIVFGTKNQLPLNFGVLLAWVALSCFTIPLFIFIARRRDMKAYRAQRMGGREAAGVAPQ
ncbi:hypothetical protein BDV98DRAFT_563751 [Pterulicium gracile]|uniref:DUF3533 domain-containing protein n=1 Tax=Pterulicium gracile TaxID=1884261 RepID=A0A5C3QTQ3_9AGAR|nr:hypothetical protein BDV98DRAFT_563751 [Pterula gracilis]